jgi:diphosphomevalonate decarboxylase
VKATVEASPSLALVKYWGKRDGPGNYPATSSLAVTLGALRTRTTAECGGTEDRIEVNGAEKPVSLRYAILLDRVREATGYDGRFSVKSRNDFATAAGLASSSSGFAALTAACVLATGARLDATVLSAIARTGSASAARSVFGGFVVLREGEEAAEQVRDERYWPDLRIVVCTVTEREKSVSSGEAMELTKRSSPFFQAWIEDSRAVFAEALDALAAKDVQRLGDLARLSYLRMHAVLLAANPPVIYAEPDSLRIVRICGELRARGIGAWETMDAGPQVKILCSASDVSSIILRLRDELSDLSTTVSAAGTGVRPVAGDAG